MSQLPLDLENLTSNQREEVLAALRRQLAQRVRGPIPGQGLLPGFNTADLVTQGMLRDVVRDAGFGAKRAAKRPTAERSITGAAQRMRGLEVVDEADDYARLVTSRLRNFGVPLSQLGGEQSVTRELINDIVERAAPGPETDRSVKKLARAFGMPEDTAEQLTKKNKAIGLHLNNLVDRDPDRGIETTKGQNRLKGTPRAGEATPRARGEQLRRNQVMRASNRELVNDIMSMRAGERAGVGPVADQPIRMKRGGPARIMTAGQMRGSGLPLLEAAVAEETAELAAKAPPLQRGGRALGFVGALPVEGAGGNRAFQTDRTISTAETPRVGVGRPLTARQRAEGLRVGDVDPRASVGRSAGFADTPLRSSLGFVQTDDAVFRNLPGFEDVQNISSKDAAFAKRVNKYYEQLSTPGSKVGGKDFTGLPVEKRHAIAVRMAEAETDKAAQARALKDRNKSLTQMARERQARAKATGLPATQIEDPAKSGPRVRGAFEEKLDTARRVRGEAVTKFPKGKGPIFFDPEDAKRFPRPTTIIDEDGSVRGRDKVGRNKGPKLNRAQMLAKNLLGKNARAATLAKLGGPLGILGILATPAFLAMEGSAAKEQRRLEIQNMGLGMANDSIARQERALAMAEARSEANNLRALAALAEVGADPMPARTAELASLLGTSGAYAAQSAALAGRMAPMASQGALGMI
tara:strand:+ start:10306 stop:12384 length:2079 start_codon:yes stop_codon:yes gene_type:complete